MEITAQVSLTSPIDIFLSADHIVQSLMVLLIFASVYSWAQIIARGISITRERRHSAVVRKNIRSIESIGELRQMNDLGDGRILRILSAMATEWAWSSDNASRRDYGEVRQRLASVAELSIAREYSKLASQTTWLGTIGNSAPFVGLFGTVWGIMNSFIAIGQAQDTSLAVVAPGMAEALLATALGLFCAIPASIGYNRILNALSKVDQEWRAIAGHLEVMISRQYGNIR